MVSAKLRLMVIWPVATRWYRALAVQARFKSDHGGFLYLAGLRVSNPSAAAARPAYVDGDPDLQVNDLTTPAGVIHGSSRGTGGESRGPTGHLNDRPHALIGFRKLSEVIARLMALVRRDPVGLNCFDR
jgi:hypothetical protein